MLAMAMSVGTTEIVVPLFFNTPFVGREVIRIVWSVSPALGSANPALKVAAENVRVVSSFVFGEMLDTTGGCSTRVTVGSAAPPTFGSSVRTLEKLPPLTVPWFEMAVAAVGLLIVTANFTITDFPGGNVPMLTGDPRYCACVTLPGIAPSASFIRGKRRWPVVRNPYITSS